MRREAEEEERVLFCNDDASRNAPPPSDMRLLLRRELIALPFTSLVSHSQSKGRLLFVRCTLQGLFRGFEVLSLQRQQQRWRFGRSTCARQASLFKSYLENLVMFFLHCILIEKGFVWPRRTPARFTPADTFFHDQKY
jgi:hypothetical protein